MGAFEDELYRLRMQQAIQQQQYISPALYGSGLSAAYNRMLSDAKAEEQKPNKKLLLLTK